MKKGGTIIKTNIMRRFTYKRMENNYLNFFLNTIKNLMPQFRSYLSRFKRVDAPTRRIIYNFKIT